MPRESRKRTLTPDAFQAFLAWLSPQMTDEGEAYEKARDRLVIFFASRRCRDPESLADKTMDIAILKMAEIPTDARPIAYLLGIAKNVFRDYLRDIEKELTASDASQKYQIASQPQVERNHTCLERCLNELPQEDRTILLAYYSQAKRAKIELHRQLAERHKLTLNALRNRIFRLNQRMARCIDKCLEILPM
jgi:DNA-directed RNA polymerase specialized sigma24 family protein